MIDDYSGTHSITSDRMLFMNLYLLNKSCTVCRQLFKVGDDVEIGPMNPVTELPVYTRHERCGYASSRGEAF